MMPIHSVLPRMWWWWWWPGRRKLTFWFHTAAVLSRIFKFEVDHPGIVYDRATPADQQCMSEERIAHHHIPYSTLFDFRVLSEFTGAVVPQIWIYIYFFSRLLAVRASRNSLK